MNSKKKLASLGFTVLAIFIFTGAKAQPQLNYNNNNFSITTPAIGYQVFQGINTPYTNVFFETGTGDFFIFSTKDDPPSYEQKSFYKNWYTNTSLKIQPVVQLSTFYDTTIKPHSNSYIVTQSSSGTNPPNPHLLTGNVTITNAIKNIIIPGDTMTLALTYKNTTVNPSFSSCSSYNKSVIAFFYNSQDNPGLFSQIPAGDGARPYKFNGINVPALRKHIDDNVLSTVDNSLLTIINQANQNNIFNNSLYLSVPYSASGQEKNIFLSMVPAPNAALTDIQISNGGFVEAILIDYDSSNISKCHTVSIITQSYSISRFSRDPNYIRTIPSALGGPNNCANKNIDYKIHFTNTGAGTANKIIVTASIPQEIDIPDPVRYNCKIGDNIVQVAREGSINLLEEKNKRWCLYRLEPATHQIVFTITNANLLGKQNEKKRLNTGDISFILRTINDNSRIHECMYSTVSIKFDNNAPVTDACILRRYPKDICRFP